MFRDPSSLASRVVAAALLVGGAFLFYRAAFLIGSGHAAHYVGWLRALTWIELAIAATIAVSALAWLIGGAEAWCGRTLRLTAAIILLHAVRVAVFILARTGPWIDFDLRPEARPLDPANWSWVGVWIAGSGAVTSLVVLVSVLIWWHRKRTIHN